MEVIDKSIVKRIATMIGCSSYLVVTDDIVKLLTAIHKMALEECIATEWIPYPEKTPPEGGYYLVRQFSTLEQKYHVWVRYYDYYMHDWIKAKEIVYGRIMSFAHIKT